MLYRYSFVFPFDLSLSQPFRNLLVVLDNLHYCIPATIASKHKKITMFTGKALFHVKAGRRSRYQPPQSHRELNLALGLLLRT